MWPFRPKIRADFTKAAEELIKEVCARHGLNWVPDDAPVELLLRIPVQDGLSTEIIAGLQNCDELNLGIGHFWSYFFPFEKKKADFEASLDGFIRGECRVVEYRRRDSKEPVACALERREGHGWVIVYAHSKAFRSTRNAEISYITNTAAKAC